MTGNKNKTPAVMTPAQVQAKKAKAKARREKQKAKKAQAAGMTTASAPVNTGAKVKGITGKSIREQGTDQLTSISVATTVGKAILTQQVITPAVFPRLAQLAKSFQRIKYHRLRFEIVTGTPTTTGGVYVAGFIADATDPVNAVTASSTLLASGGSSTKYWQSTEVVVNKFPPELYYTNPHEGEERWSSPGSLVIASISSPTQAVDFEVFCHWDVSLSKPTYDAPGKTEEGVHKVKVHVYSSNGNKYLSTRNGNDWRPLAHSDFDPSLSVDGIYVLGGWRTASVQAADEKLSGSFGFFAVQLKRSGSGYYVYPLDDLSRQSTENFHGEEYVIRKGELVFRVQSLDHSKDPWFRSHRNPLHSWQNKLMSSRLPWTSPEYWMVNDLIPERPSSAPYGVDLPCQDSGGSGPPYCAKSSESSSKSLTTLKELLAEAISSPLQESLTDFLHNLRVTSSTACPSLPPEKESDESLEYELV